MHQVLRGWRSPVARVAVVLATAVLAAPASAALDSDSSLPVARFTRVARHDALGGRVRIDVWLTTASKGTFAIAGAIEDRGTIRVTQRVVNGRLVLTERLAGNDGTIAIRVVRRCSATSGAWQVVPGTRAYAGVAGGGSASGGPRCAGTSYPVKAVYAGNVRLPEPQPPQPVAQAGRYGGATSQRLEVVFDVDQGGKTVSGLSLAITAACEGGVVPSTQSFFRLVGPLAIERDGTFTSRVETTFQTGTVSGRFTSQTTAEGSAEVKTRVTVTSTNTTYACAGSVTWRATLPPPTATPGKYCGYTIQGASICFDVASGGREVETLDVGVVVRCQPSSEFELTLRFTKIPIGGHLGFSQQATSFEGFLSGRGSVSGLIDLDGGAASGRAGVQQPSFDYEGTRYTCGVAAATWSVKRQS